MNIHHIDAFRTVTEQDEKNELIIRWAGHYFKDKSSSLNRVHNRYYFIYVYDGRGYIVNNRGEQESVGAGSIILFRPGERQRLWANPDDPFSYYGSCFCGAVIDSLLKDSPICSATHHPEPLDRRMVSMMDSFLNLMLLHRGDYDELLVVSKLFAILARVNTIITVTGEQSGEKKNAQTALDMVEQYLRIHYNKPVNIKELAAISRYSVTWLDHHFKEKFGATPMKYLMQIRIRKAQHLLCLEEGEQLNVAQISYAVGYEDPLYFSKVFKKATGLSPKDYRKTYGGQ